VKSSHVGQSPVIKNDSDRSQQRGQGMTEYIIIVALVAVAAIAVYQSFGKVIRSQTAAIANELAGESSQTAISNARSAAKDALGQTKDKTLKSYGAQTR
jgi:type IV pilus assembly protein PilA